MTKPKDKPKKTKSNKARRKASGQTRALPRKVHFGGKHDGWTYSVRGDKVSIRSPKGLVRQFRRSTVSGFISIEPSEEKNVSVTPADVKEFVMDAFGASSASFEL